MSWGTYAAFLAFAIAVVLVPGPDFTVVLRNCLTGGRRYGAMAALGVASSNLTQGTAAALGLSAIIVRSEPVFLTIRWLGVGYLCLLGVRALRSAWRGRYDPPARITRARRGWRQGFLSNITNPKVLALYLSVLPAFLGDGHPTLGQSALLAYTHATLSLLWLMTVVMVVHTVRAWVARRRVRRTMDAVTGSALLGFGVDLAVSR